MRRTRLSDAEARAILAAKRTRPPPRPPPPASRSLAPTLKALEAKFGHDADALKVRWKEIVGEVLARRSEPVKLVRQRTGGAILELRVDGPAAALIQHQAGQIIQRLNLFLGEGEVTKLRIVQGLLRPAAKAAPPRRRRAPPPLDAAAEAELAAGLADLKDGPLRDSLTKLGRHVLAAKPR